MRTLQISLIISALALLALSPLCLANVKPASLFTDHMVLQQESDAPIWGTADPGEKVTVRASWQWKQPVTAAADTDGKWMLKIPTTSAGGPHLLHIEGKNTVILEDVMIGQVWLASGQSNMVWPLTKTKAGQQAIQNAGKYPSIRLFQATGRPSDEPQDTINGKWQLSSPDSAPRFSAAAYYFGLDLHKELDVPIGLIQSAWGGSPAEAWLESSYLQSVPALSPIVSRWRALYGQMDEYEQQYRNRIEQWKKQVQKAKQQGKPVPRKPSKPNPMKEHKRPSLLYNGMIAPLTPFRVRGVIWYQGESNREHPEEYKPLFSTMIKNFRDVFEQPDMPFYFVQIAPFRYRNPSAKRAAWIRQAQLEVNNKVPNTEMVITTDLVDDISDIHPQIKKPVGHRLALCALAKTYGRDIAYSGPIYKSMQSENSKVRVFFDHVNGGLAAKGKLSHFEIAGPDGTFYPAEAKIDGETVVVQTDQVEDPEHVRFGFSNTAEPNLFNKAGLPASPFTTEKSTNAG